MTLRLALNPTAAPIREGHRLRIGAAKACYSLRRHVQLLRALRRPASMRLSAVTMSSCSACIVSLSITRPRVRHRSKPFSTNIASPSRSASTRREKREACQSRWRAIDRPPPSGPLGLLVH